MTNKYFYPDLIRQEEKFYFSKRGHFYADYTQNYDMIFKDCLGRCVYCDITEREQGGDKLSLDHFRPQDVFKELEKGILLIHPYNLHLSCQKCNVLKSNDWKGCRESVDGHTHELGQGYIDRFKESVTGYLSVQEDGTVVCANPDGPAKYLINRLFLNRTNRVFIRKKRLYNGRIKELSALLNRAMDKVIASLEGEKYDKVKALKILKELKSIQAAFHDICHPN